MKHDYQTYLLPTKDASKALILTISESDLMKKIEAGAYMDKLIEEYNSQTVSVRKRKAIVRSAVEYYRGAKSLYLDQYIRKTESSKSDNYELPISVKLDNKFALVFNVLYDEWSEKRFKELAKQDCASQVTLQMSDGSTMTF